MYVNVDKTLKKCMRQTSFNTSIKIKEIKNKLFCDDNNEPLHKYIVNIFMLHHSSSKRRGEVFVHKRKFEIQISLLFCFALF